MFNLDADFTAFDSFYNDLDRDRIDVEADWDLDDDIDTELSIADEFPQLAEKLRKQGAVLIRLEYSGHDGVGHFQDIHILDESCREINISLPDALLRDFREYCTVLLNVEYPEWSQEHGSCGDFSWDVLKNSFAHSHHPTLRETSRSNC